MGRLDGKVAIITGGAGGIGGSISLALAASGYSVVINFNKSKVLILIFRAGFRCEIIVKNNAF